MDVNILLFDNFETLDIMGPIEIVGRFPEHYLCYYTLNGGVVTNRHKMELITKPIGEAPENGVLIIPGGMGTRTLVNDEAFLAMLREQCEKAQYVLSICTGSAVLAKAGVLDGKSATSNKMSFSWVKSVSDKVHWQPAARWVVDGKFYTSSGVSAGMDMALGFISDIKGRSEAERVAHEIEYIWNDNSTEDPFKAE